MLGRHSLFGRVEFGMTFRVWQTNMRPNLDNCLPLHIKKYFKSNTIRLKKIEK